MNEILMLLLVWAIAFIMTLAFFRGARCVSDSDAGVPKAGKPKKPVAPRKGAEMSVCFRAGGRQETR